MIEMFKVWACKHEWVLMNTTRVAPEGVTKREIEEGTELILGTKWTCACKKCLKVKKIRSY